MHAVPHTAVQPVEPISGPRFRRRSRQGRFDSSQWILGASPLRPLRRPAKPVFCRMSPLRPSASSCAPTVWAFGSSPTTPAADFYVAFRSPCGFLSSHSETVTQISRGKLDCLPCTIAGSTLCALDGYGLRRQMPLRPALTPHPVFVHRPTGLLHASFRLASRLPPCASLVLHLHQVGQKTFTSELSSMLGTHLECGGHAAALNRRANALARRLPSGGRTLC